MVHVKDYVFVNNRHVACPSGEGVIDFKNCFRALKDAGYDGYLSLEYECSIGDPKQGITTSLVNMRRLRQLAEKFSGNPAKTLEKVVW